MTKLLTNSYSSRRNSTIVTKYSTFIESDVTHLTDLLIVLAYKTQSRYKRSELEVRICAGSFYICNLKAKKLIIKFVPQKRKSKTICP